MQQFKVYQQLDLHHQHQPTQRRESWIQPLQPLQSKRRAEQQLQSLQQLLIA